MRRLRRCALQIAIGVLIAGCKPGLEEDVDKSPRSAAKTRPGPNPAQAGVLSTQTFAREWFEIALNSPKQLSARYRGGVTLEVVPTHVGATVRPPQGAPQGPDPAAGEGTVLVQKDGKTILEMQFTELRGVVAGKLTRVHCRLGGAKDDGRVYALDAQIPFLHLRELIRLRDCRKR